MVSLGCLGGTDDTMEDMAMNPRDPNTPAATANEWARWRRSVFGDPYLVWHDGPDFTALLRAGRSDLQAVARMLVAGVNAGDPLAAESIAALAGAGLTPEGSQALLRAAVPSASGTFLVRLAQALHKLTADQSWANPIAAVLTTARHWGERIDAAIALTEFDPTTHLIQALSRAVCDPEYLVRYHAANTLLRYAGHPHKVTDLSEIFTKIKTPAAGQPSAADRAAWQSVADQLSANALR
jgi:hypothetical protein